MRLGLYTGCMFSLKPWGLFGALRVFFSLASTLGVQSGLGLKIGVDVDRVR